MFTTRGRGRRIKSDTRYRGTCPEHGDSAPETIQRQTPNPDPSLFSPADCGHHLHAFQCNLLRRWRH